MATIQLEPQTESLFRRMLDSLKPPPDLTLSQWADRYRKLSPEASAAPGQWHTDNAPYQRGVMDAISDPHVRQVVFREDRRIHFEPYRLLYEIPSGPHDGDSANREPWRILF